MSGSDSHLQHPLLQGLLAELKDNACGDVSVLEAREDAVDLGERLQLDIRFHLASGGKVQRFRHVGASSDKGTADCDAVRDDIKERDGKISRGESYESTSAAFARHGNPLLERDQ
jgi:hypothetical protein